MVEWETSDQEIESTEKLLLPEGAHFQDDARNVIRCWHSIEVSACPGSGKTTILLAKLKLLADRMPLENGAGICVLSHTNVAVNQVKQRLSGYADRLLRYPNYIGTIQSFIDRFVTMPYLRATFGHTVEAVDNRTYAQHMLDRMKYTNCYNSLFYFTTKRVKLSGQFSEIIDFLQALYIKKDGALYVGNQKGALAGANSDSAKQYKELIQDLLEYEGIMKYEDAYAYAEKAVNELPGTYTDLFSSRFQYVFVDEYQDCNDLQRQAINALFDSSKCMVMKMGDPDQSIYNSEEEGKIDWEPVKDFYLSSAVNTLNEELIISFFFEKNIGICCE